MRYWRAFQIHQTQELTKEELDNLNPCPRHTSSTLLCPLVLFVAIPLAFQVSIRVIRAIRGQASSYHPFNSPPPRCSRLYFFALTFFCPFVPP